MSSFKSRIRSSVSFSGHLAGASTPGFTVPFPKFLPAFNVRSFLNGAFSESFVGVSVSLEDVLLLKTSNDKSDQYGHWLPSPQFLSLSNSLLVDPPKLKIDKKGLSIVVPGGKLFCDSFKLNEIAKEFPNMFLVSLFEDVPNDSSLTAKRFSKLKEFKSSVDVNFSPDDSSRIATVILTAPFPSLWDFSSIKPSDHYFVSGMRHNSYTDGKIDRNMFRNLLKTLQEKLDQPGFREGSRRISIYGDLIELHQCLLSGMDIFDISLPSIMAGSLFAFRFSVVPESEKLRDALQIFKDVDKHLLSLLSDPKSADESEWNEDCLSWSVAILLRNIELILEDEKQVLNAFPMIDVCSVEFENDKRIFSLVNKQVEVIKHSKSVNSDQTLNSQKKEISSLKNNKENEIPEPATPETFSMSPASTTDNSDIIIDRDNFDNKTKSPLVQLPVYPKTVEQDSMKGLGSRVAEREYTIAYLHHLSNAHELGANLLIEQHNWKLLGLLFSVWRELMRVGEREILLFIFWFLKTQMKISEGHPSSRRSNVFSKQFPLPHTASSSPAHVPTSAVTESKKRARVDGESIQKSSKLQKVEKQDN